MEDYSAVVVGLFFPLPTLGGCTLSSIRQSRPLSAGLVSVSSSVPVLLRGLPLSPFLLGGFIADANGSDCLGRIGTLTANAPAASGEPSTPSTITATSTGSGNLMPSKSGTELGRPGTLMANERATSGGPSTPSTITATSTGSGNLMPVKPGTAALRPRLRPVGRLPGASGASVNQEPHGAVTETGAKVSPAITVWA